MSKLSFKKRLIKRALVFGVTAAFVAALGGANLIAYNTTAKAESASSSSCNYADYVIPCGVSSQSNFASLYENGAISHGKVTIAQAYQSSPFQVSLAEVQHLVANPLSGYVTRSGDVYVNGRPNPVATGAVTAGWEQFSCSPQSQNGLGLWVRPPACGFAPGVSSLPAFVDMDNGIFQFAVLTDCGNPIHAIPKLPNYTITKQVAVAGSNDFGSNVSVHPGDRVEFKVTVNSTGQTSVNNLVVEDDLPSQFTYDQGSLTLNGKGESSSDANQFFGNGLFVQPLDPGLSATFEFSAIAGNNDEGSTCNNETLTNTSSMTAFELPAKGASASVAVVCIPKPKLPNYTITKQVAVFGTNDYGSNVTVHPGDRVTFRINVVSTGQADVTNLKVEDDLPSQFSYDNNSLTLNGHNESAGAGQFFGNGLGVGSLAPGNVDTFTFSAIAGNNDEGSTCNNETLTNTSTESASSLPNQSASASVNVVCVPKTPNYTILKQVAIAGSNNYGPSVTVNPGTKVDYRVKIVSTGQADVTNLVAKDALPKDVTFDSGSLTLNGHRESTADANKFFDGGLPLGSLAPGANDTFNFSAIAGTNDKTKCVNETLTNTATESATSLPNMSSQANVLVVCKPVPKSPNYTIVKEVALHGSNNFSSHVEVNPNTEVDYRITIKSTGTADVTNLLVKDILPNDDSYIASTLTFDGKPVTQQDIVKAFFGGGVLINKLAPGAVATFEFSAIAGANQNNPNCTNETLPNQATMEATSLPSENSIATVSVECVPSSPTTTPTPTPTSTTTPSAPTSTPTPTVLVNTGPGSFVGTFVGFSIAGAAGYMLFLRRRLANQ